MTAPEVSPRSDSTEPETQSPWVETGYSIPFDPSDMTPGQAHQLHNVQGIGGPVAARIAARPERPPARDPRVEREAALRWLDHNYAERQKLEQRRKEARERHDIYEAAKLTAQLEGSWKTRERAVARLGNLTAQVEALEKQE